MNQKILAWANIDAKEWPGAFREKDLELLFKQCVQKYNQIEQLIASKGHAINKSSQEGKNFENGNKKDAGGAGELHSKKSADINKYKCTYKSCGKIMTSELSFKGHLQKHGQKKSNRKSQAHISDQLGSQQK